MRKWYLILLSILLLIPAPWQPAAADQRILDLRGQKFDSLQQLTQRIDEADGITAVDLNGVTLTADEMKSLLAAYPALHFKWTVRVFGLDISSEDTEADFDGKKIGKISELRDALDCLPALKNIYMWKAPLKREQRDELFQAYPDRFFGWAIQMNTAHVIRTDATAFSTLGKRPGLNFWQMHNFSYCRDLKALDIGHNTIKDLSFLEELPKLKILILADTKLTDISPIACQTDLEYLELFLNDITDISALANLKNLRDVNLAFNNISDLSPLYDLPNLERVWLMMNKKIRKEDIEKLQELHPDCEIIARSYGATGNVWLENGTIIPGTSWRDHPHYDTIFYVFNGGGYVDWDTPVPKAKHK